MFSHSLKVQARNPKKVYVMDMGLYTENSVTTSENTGRRLENLIFLHLRKKYKQIFHKNKRKDNYNIKKHHNKNIHDHYISNKKTTVLI